MILGTIISAMYICHSGSRHKSPFNNFAMVEWLAQANRHIVLLVQPYYPVGIILVVSDGKFAISLRNSGVKKW